MSQHRTVSAFLGFILSAALIAALSFVPSAGMRITLAAGSTWTVNNFGGQAANRGGFRVS